ncbi:DUF4245 domain-containing protein [Microbacterium sp. RU33B]|uniref:DUF4245 domain-containing protein n=1 Tax=Microbacterium sp. RU33B TaxID=1907390 RepID=UPI000964686A|nr:DUF4245 domain-containing protein [Microbacterium sp. RU33B]SIT71383.1 Protein of unknown function [Microbacterium sp. RU33B]
MMAQGPRVVAELGRPETPDETAARKAESSRVYRSSQSFRNLIAALIATLAIVLVVVFIVPRGQPAPRDPIDVAAAAERVADAQGRTAIVPEVPSGWIVNRASVEGDSVSAWTIIYVPGEELGVVTIAQGFDADAAWSTRVLSGAGVTDVVTIDGIEWNEYAISDPARAKNITAALSTQAGADTILVYGATDRASLEAAAASVADQVRTLREGE